MSKISLTLISSCLAAIVMMTLAAAADLDRILSQMEKKGATVDSFHAQLLQRKWTEILEEFDEGEQGEFRFLRKDGQIYLRKDIQSPKVNHLVIRDGEVTFYQPSIKQAQKHRLGRNKDKAEFLLLGFGTTRSSLEEAYKIRLLGEERVGSVPTYILELVPRSSNVSAYFSKIVLWVDAGRWIPIQQKLIEPTEDYLLVTFEEVEINPRLSPKDFEIRLPKDVKIVKTG